MTEYDKVIHPGGVGKITASVSTVNFKGPVSKGITVTTNDPARPTFQLQIKADVFTPIDVQPEYLNFNGLRGELKPAEVRIHSLENKPFNIVNISSDGNVKVEVRPDTGPVTPPAPPAPVKPAPQQVEKKKERGKGKERDKGNTAEKGIAKGEGREMPLPPGTDTATYLLTVTPEPGLPVGQVRGQILLTTDHSKSSQLQVSYFINVRGEVEVLPMNVYFPPTPAGASGANVEPPAQHVKVRKPQGTELKILRVESSDPEIQTSVKPLVEGREYDIEVRYTGKPGRGILRSQLTLKTNDPNQSSIIVSVTGRL